MEFVLKMSFVIVLLLYFGSFAQGAPRIVAPYPNNVYAIENGTTQVTCVVEDAVSNPDKIVFVRKTRFGDILPIPDEGPSGRIYYQNETLDGGSKLRVTLHFNQVTLNDDSRNGGYECQGRTGSSQHEYGFTVTVIELSEIPEVHATGNVTAKFGERIQLSCNVTTKKRWSSTEISQFIWTKDGTFVSTSYCSSLSSIKPLVLNVSSADMGGNYTCYVEYLLRRVKKGNITKTMIVKVQPEFLSVKKEEKKDKRLVCSAQGYPLVTEWKRKTLCDNDIIVFDTEDSSSKGKYVFSNMDGFKDHTLTIHDVRPTDAGQYYCCIKNTTSPRSPEDVSNCQMFDVRLPPPGSSVGKASLTYAVVFVGFLLIRFLQ